MFALDAATAAPVGGATVTVRGAPNGDVHDRQATDPGGRAVVSATPEDYVFVAAEGYAPWAPRRQLGDAVELEVLLLRPATLHGKVLDADGRALSTVDVRVVEQNRELLARPTTTLADGSYSLVLAPSTDFEVVPGAAARATVDLEPGATLRLHSDASVAGASVTLWDGEGWLDELTLAPDSVPALLIPAGRPVLVEVRAADDSWREEQTLTLEPGATREVLASRP